jgi:hypothetical protein
MAQSERDWRGNRNLAVECLIRVLLSFVDLYQPRLAVNRFLHSTYYGKLVVVLDVPTLPKRPVDNDRRCVTAVEHAVWFETEKRAEVGRENNPLHCCWLFSST